MKYLHHKRASRFALMLMLFLGFVLAAEAQTVMQVGVYVNPNLIPKAVPGYTTRRVERIPQHRAPFLPTASSVGAFRLPCGFSHMLFDDPIVLPNQPGASHLHEFHGNGGVNAYSTAATNASSGDSTCAGGVLERSGMWFPAMVDMSTSGPVTATSFSVYYKTAYPNLLPTTQVQAMPAGLRMIAGDPTNTTASGPFTWTCWNGSIQVSNTYNIPACIGGTQIQVIINFPRCWDGVNLDSPDHKSHMSDMVQVLVGSSYQYVCPADHPVGIPVISYVVYWNIDPAVGATNWRLASDANLTVPAGYTMHADWWNGWDAKTEATWVKNCEEMSLDCADFLLGNGTMLY